MSWHRHFIEGSGLSSGIGSGLKIQKQFEEPKESWIVGRKSKLRCLK